MGMATYFGVHFSLFSDFFSDQRETRHALLVTGILRFQSLQFRLCLLVLLLPHRRLIGSAL